MTIQTEFPLTVLVVDDIATQRQLLSDVILFLYPDWNIVEAENGKQGLKLAQTLHPDLIITDFRMPFMNGYEMALELQDNPSTCEIPLVLVSSSDLENAQVRQLSLLCQATLAKPFTLSSLAYVLKNLVRARLIPVEMPRQHWPMAISGDYAQLQYHLDYCN
ncbi:MAG: response regulator [Caldilineaceae bacterium]